LSYLYQLQRILATEWTTQRQQSLEKKGERSAEDRCFVPRTQQWQQGTSD